MITMIHFQTKYKSKKKTLHTKMKKMKKMKDIDITMDPHLFLLTFLHT